NWMDASFKTFCTPLRIPFPVEMKAGTRVQQTVTLRLRESMNSQFSILNSQSSRASADTVSQSFPMSAPLVQVEIVPKMKRPVPEVGVAAPSHNFGLCEKDIDRLEALNLAHVRLDLRLEQPNWAGALWLAAGSADSDAKLELALHFPSVSPMLMKDV